MYLLVETASHMSLHLGAYSSIPPFANGDDPAGGTQAERARAWGGQFSYAGPYTFEGGGTEGVVRHKMAVGSYPNWYGRTSERSFQLEQDGDGERLVLGTREPVRMGGEERQMVLVWRRA